MMMDVLDGVLHRNDVAVAAVIDAVDHAGKRGRFPRSGAAGDEHQTFLGIGQREHALRNAELHRVGQTEVDDADDRGQRAALPENIHAETAQIPYRKGEVVIDPALQVAAVSVGKLIDILNHRLDFRRLHDIVRQAFLMSFAFEGDRQAGNQEHVGCTHGNRFLHNLEYGHMDQNPPSQSWPMLSSSAQSFVCCHCRMSVFPFSFGQKPMLRLRSSCVRTVW